MARCLAVFFACIILIAVALAEDKPKKKKDVRDYTDADLDRLFEEWEANDEDELEDDEKPDNMRKNPPKVDFSTFGGNTPEEMIKQSKKGQQVMLFAGVVDPSGKPITKEFTDTLVKIWQTSLFNNHIECQVFVVESNRAVFMIAEGSLAFEARDYLLKQEQIADITLEGKYSEGAGHKYMVENEKKEAKSEL